MGGPRTLKDSNTLAHPMQAVELEHTKNQRMTQKQMMANVYGSHLPMQLTMEERILSQFQRFPGLRSSFVGLETLVGDDTRMEFADYLNDPSFSTEPVDVHSAMEARLGDKPAPRFI